MMFWLSLPLIYLLLSVLCFFAYAADKSAARRGQRRTPESRLLLLGFLGGWPGALLAQQFLRHKTRKQPFLLLFWCTVAANLSLLLVLARYLQVVGNIYSSGSQ